MLLFCYIVPADDGQIRGDSIRKLLKISVPLGLASMVGTLDSYLDKWIVSAMLSPETYAVFANGAHEIPFIGAITGAITTVILVDMTRACKCGDYAQALQLFRGAAEKTSMILLPIMMLLLVLSEPLIAFLYTDAYLGAVNVFRVYVLFLPMRHSVLRFDHDGTRKGPRRTDTCSCCAGGKCGMQRAVCTSFWCDWRLVGNDFSCLLR